MHTMAPESLKLSQVGSMGWTLVGGRGYQRLHIASFMSSAAQNIAVLYWKEYLAYPARALRALGLLLADGTPTVEGGKTF